MFKLQLGLLKALPVTTKRLTNTGLLLAQCRTSNTVEPTEGHDDGAPSEVANILYAANYLIFQKKYKKINGCHSVLHMQRFHKMCIVHLNLRKNLFANEASLCCNHIKSNLFKHDFRADTKSTSCVDL